MTTSYASPLVCPVNRWPKTSIRGHVVCQAMSVCRTESPHFPGPTPTICTTLPAITTRSSGKEELVAWADRRLHRSVLRSSISTVFISLLSWPPIYLPRSEAVGSPDLELSTPSHICLVCKSIYCCIHSFPMCFTGTPEKAVTSDVGSGHSQLSSHLCTWFFFSISGTVWWFCPLTPFSSSLPVYWPC